MTLDALFGNLDWIELVRWTNFGWDDLSFDSSSIKSLMSSVAYSESIQQVARDSSET